MFEDVNTIYIIFWAVLLIAALVVEAQSEALLSIWFAAGAIPSLILAAMGNSAFILQVAIFAITSSILLVLSKYIFKNALKKPSDRSNTLKTNVDGVIGKNGISKDEIKIDQNGYVRVNGMDWLAYTTSEETISPDDKVEVIAVEGVKLHIKKIN